MWIAHSLAPPGHIVLYGLRAPLEHAAAPIVWELPGVFVCHLISCLCPKPVYLDPN